MPTYDIRNKKTGKVKEIFCSYKDKDKALKEEGPDWEYMVCAPEINYTGQSTISRCDNGWKDHLSRISAAAGKDRSWRKKTINTGR
jgi:hypothetical protein